MRWINCYGRLFGSVCLSIFLCFAPIVNGFAQTKYELRCNARLLELSEKFALSQVGIIEHGENRNKYIDIYLSTVGLPPGNAYCAAGVYWSFASAAHKLDMDNTQVPIPRTGLANAMFDFARQHGIRVKYSPARHDLIVYRFSRSIHGHIERIIECGSKGWVSTIAFNTRSDDGNAEGVFIKKRNIYAPLGRMTIRGLIGFRS